LWSNYYRSAKKYTLVFLISFASKSPLYGTLLQVIFFVMQCFDLDKSVISNTKTTSSQIAFLINIIIRTYQSIILLASNIHIVVKGKVSD
jgi:hypothetical protein